MNYLRKILLTVLFAGLGISFLACDLVGTTTVNNAENIRTLESLLDDGYGFDCVDDVCVIQGMVDNAGYKISYQLEAAIIVCENFSLHGDVYSPDQTIKVDFNTDDINIETFSNIGSDYESLTCYGNIAEETWYGYSEGCSVYDLENIYEMVPLDFFMVILNAAEFTTKDII